MVRYRAPVPETPYSREPGYAERYRDRRFTTGSGTPTIGKMPLTMMTTSASISAPEVVYQERIVYKEGKGFTFATQDDRFSLSVGGRLQVRYTLTGSTAVKTATANIRALR